MEKVEFSKFINFLIYSLLSLILIVPTLYQPIKAGIILLILFAYIISPVHKIKIKHKIIVWLFIFIFCNAFFLFLGSLKRAESFVELAPVNLIWPILYFLVLVMPLSINEIRINVYSFFPKIGIIISLFTLYIFVSYKGIIPIFPLLKNVIPYSINSYGGYVSYFSPNITSLFFLIPITLVGIFNAKSKKHKDLCIVSCILMICSSFLVGRRALILVQLSVLLLLFIIKVAMKEISFFSFFRFVFFFLIILLAIFLTIRILNLDLRILDLENVAQNSDSLRTLQFRDLINSWKKHPIIGVGLGVNSAGVVRSTSVSGAYELSYVALLFQTGVVGVVIYSSLYLYLFIQLSKCYISTKDSTYLSFFLCFFSILVAQATNPYINSFDGMWIFYFILAILNRYPSSINGE